jgi:hypothetical protein
MGGAYSSHWRDDKRIQKLWLEILRGREHLEDLRVCGRIILKWTLKNRF